MQTRIKTFIFRFLQEGIAAAVWLAVPGVRAEDTLIGERYPETRLRVLSAEDVGKLNADQLRYAINEMFARHGADFKDAQTKKLFSKLDWYRPIKNRNYDEAEALFSQTESENVKILGKRRDELKGKTAGSPSAPAGAPEKPEPDFVRPGTKEKAALDRAEAELNAVLDGLSNGLTLEQQKKLGQEQEAWIKLREEEITRRLGPPRGGSGYRLDYLEAVLDLVQMRTAALENYGRPTVGRVSAEEKQGILTRELAGKILNEHLAEPSISQLEFRDGGLQQAAKDGIIRERGNFPPNFLFTDKGLKMVSRVLGNNYIELAPFGMQAPKFSLKRPIGQRTNRITGIADGANPGMKLVELETEYLFPPEMFPLRRYLFTGVKLEVNMRKYDDGWRVVK